MFSNTMRTVSIAFLIFAFSAICLSAQSSYVLTPRDTGLDPMPMETDSDSRFDPAYQFLYEGDNLQFFFRDDRDVFAVRDKRNGYVWKTGLDIPFNRDIDDMLDDGADPLTLPPMEDRLNTTFTGIANSIVSIEYFDSARNIKRSSSAARQDVTSEFSILQSEPFAARLDVYFDDIDLSMTLNFSIEGDEFIVEIPDEQLSGEGLADLAAVTIAPFFGASGGQKLLWDPLEEDFEIEQRAPAPDGYALVPDGSGALIRFADNYSELSEYSGDVYGRDLSQRGSFRSYDDFSVAPKNTYMPMYGIVHGRQQNAFAAFASSGDEYLEILSIPEENTTYYTLAYPRFVYNRLYFQVYNQKGDGYFRVLEERNHFDIRMHYAFLAGDGDQGYSADYSGIAGYYRQSLIERGLLAAPRELPGQSAEAAAGDIPLRIDFLMADVRDSVVGRSHEITTTVEQVSEIVDDLQDMGIHNLSIGLNGYSRGGTVLYRPDSLALNRSLGSSEDFAELLREFADQGIDASFIRDYNVLADGQLSLWGNAVRGASGWYIQRLTFQANAPVNEFYYSRSVRSTQWLQEASAQMRQLGAGSLSIESMGHQLFSEYNGNEVITAEEVMARYRQSLSEQRRQMQINLYQPNQYLWNLTDRFLSMPVFPTQYLLETDSVPLLPMVLHGSMQLFAPYSNFSFSSDRDVLRMIDYNVYPSFLITGESAHLLMMTNSSRFYSSEYRIYRDLILSVYDRVNAALKQVQRASWTGRRVLQPGLVRNDYDNGKSIYINYSEQSVEFDSMTVPALSAMVAEHE